MSKCIYACLPNLCGCHRLKLKKHYLGYCRSLTELIPSRGYVIDTETCHHIATVLLDGRLMVALTRGEPCRWVLAETKRLSNNEALEIDPLVQRGAQALKDRPVLFKYCAREVATARHNALFQR